MGDCVTFPISVLTHSDWVFNLFILLNVDHMKQIGHGVGDVLLCDNQRVIDDLFLAGSVAIGLLFGDTKPL